MYANSLQAKDTSLREEKANAGERRSVQLGDNPGVASIPDPAASDNSNGRGRLNPLLDERVGLFA
jgi:hypothetical protein